MLNLTEKTKKLARDLHKKQSVHQQQIYVFVLSKNYFSRIIFISFTYNLCCFKIKLLLFKIESQFLFNKLENKIKLIGILWECCNNCI